MRAAEPALARAAIWDKALEILAKDDARLAHVFDTATVNRLTEGHWQIITDDPKALALPPPVVVAMIRQATLHVTPTLYGEHAGDPFWPKVEVVSRDLLDEFLDEAPVHLDPRVVADVVAPAVDEFLVMGVDPHRPVVHLDPDTLEEARLDETRLRSLREIRDALSASIELLDKEIARLE